ncbi:MAG: hypothetical protein MJ252_23930, partial [archaeon]|nr:hypothetical protein [archaeon]
NNPSNSNPFGSNQNTNSNPFGNNPSNTNPFGNNMNQNIPEEPKKFENNSGFPGSNIPNTNNEFSIFKPESEEPYIGQGMNMGMNNQNPFPGNPNTNPFGNNYSNQPQYNTYNQYSNNNMPSYGQYNQPNTFTGSYGDIFGESIPCNDAPVFNNQFGNNQRFNDPNPYGNRDYNDNFENRNYSNPPPNKFANDYGNEGTFGGSGRYEDNYSNSHLTSAEKLQRINSIANLWINKIKSINYMIDKANYNTFNELKQEITDLRGNSYRVDNLIQEYSSDFPAKTVFTSIRSDIGITLNRYEQLQRGGKPEPFNCNCAQVKKTYYGESTSYGQKIKSNLSSIGTSIKNTTVNAYDKVCGYFKGEDPYKDDIYERKPYLKPEQEEGFFTRVKGAMSDFGNSVKSKLYGDEQP